MTSSQRDTLIKIQPWFIDHSFDNRPVLPAVESLSILATAADKFCADINIRLMKDASFSRFLEIPADTENIEAIIKLDVEDDGTLRTSLCSRQQTGRFFRQVEHARVGFIQKGGETEKSIMGDFSTNDQPCIVSGERVYKELVPFGQAYRNLTEVAVFSSGAIATLHTPDLPLTAPQELGSPFLLDSGFHAACVWGQRFAGFVPFPVGFAFRHIFKPSQPNCAYQAEVTLVANLGNELVFDIDITATTTLVEQVRGLRMRDVTGGRIQPPKWIRSI